VTVPDIRHAARSWWLHVVIVLMGVGLAVSYYFLIPVVRQQSQQARETAAAARSSCIRSKQFSPRLIDFFEYAVYTLPNGQRHHVFTPAQAAAYRAQIPKTCPGK
jgi:hypothetical protein